MLSLAEERKHGFLIYLDHANIFQFASSLLLDIFKTTNISLIPQNTATSNHQHFIKSPYLSYAIFVFLVSIGKRILLCFRSMQVLIFFFQGKVLIRERRVRS